MNAYQRELIYLDNLTAQRGVEAAIAYFFAEEPEVCLAMRRSMDMKHRHMAMWDWYESVVAFETGEH